jgi:hypothetical protein
MTVATEAVQAPPENLVDPRVAAHGGGVGTRRRTTTSRA